MKIINAKTQGLYALLVPIAESAVGPDYFRPEVDAADTRADVALNLVATYKALGGGWETELSKGAPQ